MTRFPDAVIDIRQAVAAGRVSDAISDDGVTDYAASLRYRTDRTEGSLPLVFSTLANGWFSAHLASGSLTPELSGAGEVEFVLTVTAPGYPPAEEILRVPGHRFATEEVDIEQVPGLGIRRLVGPALEFRVRLHPVAVALRGSVIYEHDPARPVPDAKVTAAPAAPVIADVHGRFTIPALPLAGMIEVLVEDGTNSHTHHLPVDYGRPVNVATLSLPESNVENDHG